VSDYSLFNEETKSSDPQCSFKELTKNYHEIYEQKVRDLGLNYSTINNSGNFD